MCVFLVGGGREGAGSKYFPGAPVLFLSTSALPVPACGPRVALTWIITVTADPVHQMFRSSRYQVSTANTVL